MSRKLIILDFDGTLSDSFPWFLTAMNLAADRFHFKTIPPDEVESFRRLNSREIIARLELPGWKLPLVARFMRRAMAENLSAICLFAGVDGVLQALHSQGVTTAILTSNSSDNVLQILGPVNSRSVAYFECGASAFGKARRLRRLLKGSGIPGRDALFIGDEIRDAEAARAAAIDFAGVSWGYAAPEVLQPFSALPVLTRIEDILAAAGS